MITCKPSKSIAVKLAAGTVLISFSLSGILHGQLATNVDEVAGSWQLTRPERTETLKYALDLAGEKKTGECKADVNQQGWSMFLNRDDDGLTGTMTLNYNRAGRPSDPNFMFCNGIVGLSYLVNYVVSLKHQGNNLAGIATPKNCVFGECPEKPVRVNVSMERGKLILMIDDGPRLELDRLK